MEKGAAGIVSVLRQPSPPHPRGPFSTQHDWTAPTVLEGFSTSFEMGRVSEGSCSFKKGLQSQFWLFTKDYSQMLTVDKQALGGVLLLHGLEATNRRGTIGPLLSSAIASTRVTKNASVHPEPVLVNFWDHGMLYRFAIRQPCYWLPTEVTGVTH